MDRVTNNIKEELENVSKRFGPVVIYEVAVTSVDMNEDTISVEFDTGLILEDVRLRSVVNNKSKFVLYPSVGSVVQIAAIEGGQDYVVIAVEEITDAAIEVSTGKIAIKKGTDTLGDLIGKVIDEVNKIVVMQGTSPNVPSLTALKTKIKNILK